MLNYGYHKEEHVGERTQKKTLEMTSIEIQGRRAVISGKTRSLCMGGRGEKKTTGKTKDQLAQSSQSSASSTTGGERRSRCVRKADHLLNYRCLM